MKQVKNLSSFESWKRLSSVQNKIVFTNLFAGNFSEFLDIFRKIQREGRRGLYLNGYEVPAGQSLGYSVA